MFQLYTVISIQLFVKASNCYKEMQTNKLKKTEIIGVC